MGGEEEEAAAVAAVVGGVRNQKWNGASKGIMEGEACADLVQMPCSLFIYRYVLPESEFSRENRLFVFISSFFNT